MSSTKKDREDFDKYAKSQGYNPTADGTKYINSQGKTAQINPSGQSFTVNGSHCSTLSDAKKKTW